MGTATDVRNQVNGALELDLCVTVPGGIVFPNIATPPVLANAILFAQGGTLVFQDAAGNVNPVFTADTAAPDNNLLGWNSDPAGAGTTFTLPTSGTVMVTQVKLRRPATVTNVVLYLTTAGGTLTSGQNFVGLYSYGGGTATLLSSSADQTTAWGSTGPVTAALSTQQTGLPAGTYYVAALFNGTTGPTLAAGSTKASGSVSVGNVGLAAPQLGRWITTAATSQTSLPATLNLAAGSLNVGGTWWAGLS